MTEYIFRYRLAGPPWGEQNGSGQVGHQLAVVYQVDLGVIPPEESWQTAEVVPGFSRTIYVPAEVILGALGSGSLGQKANAYKQALVAHRNAPLVKQERDWTPAKMTGWLNANLEAEQAAALADAFLTVDLGLTYPVTLAI